MPVLDRSSLLSPEETTLEGRVEILGDFPKGIFGESNGVKQSGLLLKTTMGRLIIQLGPAGYFKQHNFQIKAGDMLMVTGFRVMQNQVLLIRAREVQNKRKRLKLRDKDGLPLWTVSGQKPGE